MCRHGRLQRQLKGRRKGVAGVEGTKGRWTEGEGKAGWVLEGDGAEKGPQGSGGAGQGGSGAVQCTALQ